MCAPSRVVLHAPTASFDLIRAFFNRARSGIIRHRNHFLVKWLPRPRAVSAAARSFFYQNLYPALDMSDLIWVAEGDRLLCCGESSGTGERVTPTPVLFVLSSPEYRFSKVSRKFFWYRQFTSMFRNYLDHPEENLWITATECHRPLIDFHHDSCMVSSLARLTS